MSTTPHEPVLLGTVLEFFLREDPKRLIDGTVGYGGHSEALLRAAPELQLVGIDRDAEALAAARERLASFGRRVRLVQGRYSQMVSLVADLGWREVDGVLLDIGVSSPQLDTPTRGFSLRTDGPLDMRMDRREPTTAATLLNRLSEDELSGLFRRHGEERYCRRIARAVVERREERPWERTAELVELIEATVPKQGGLPPATRCFQALRIAVNRELEELPEGLAAALKLLRPGGLLVVISFHSLEDRIAKRFFRDQATSCVCPPKTPMCICGKRSTLEILTRKPIRPSEEECASNRRATPARLRAARKLAATD